MSTGDSRIPSGEALELEKMRQEELMVLEIQIAHLLGVLSMMTPRDKRYSTVSAELDKLLETRKSFV